MRRRWGSPSRPDRGARNPAGPGVWRTGRLAGQTAPDMPPSTAVAAPTAVARFTVPALCAAVLLAPAHATAPAPAPAPPPHLLVITLDTVRADRLGAYGHAAAATPRLDRLAREGALVERAQAVAPLTLPAHAS